MRGIFFCSAERNVANIHHDGATAPAQSKSSAMRHSFHSRWRILRYVQLSFSRRKTTTNQFRKSDLLVQLMKKTHHDDSGALSSFSPWIRGLRQSACYKGRIYIQETRKCCWLLYAALWGASESRRLKWPFCVKKGTFLPALSSTTLHHSKD